MGFAGLPPRPDHAVAVQALELWTRRADIAIVHEEVPWAQLIAGVAPDSILRSDKDGLVAYYRQKGLALVFVGDPTDGLGRDKEARALLSLGRSLTEPPIQRLYRDWVVAFTRRYRPEYVALAAETNLIRAIAPRALYAAVVTAANAAAADLAALPNRPRLFISVQVETAWGKLPPGPYQGVETDLRDFPFLELLGLSSYPYFAWTGPTDLPNDYYSRLLAGRNLEVMITEGGWPSASALSFVSDPSKQATYFRRQAALLTDLSAIAWLQLTPTDLDLAAFPAELRESLRPFAALGLFDPELRPKPALAVWDSAFAVTRRR